MLNDKQKRFCEEYVIDLNATQAAIRAGYSERTANRISSQLLSKLDISNKIIELQQAISERNNNLADRVVKELEKIAFANAKDFVNGGNAVLEIKHLENQKTAAISKIKTTIKDNGDIVSEIGFYDKVSALEKLGRHVGIFEKDNAQRKAEIPEVLKIEIVEPTGDE